MLVPRLRVPVTCDVQTYAGTRYRRAATGSVPVGLVRLHRRLLSRRSRWSRSRAFGSCRADRRYGTRRCTAPWSSGRGMECHGAVGWLKGWEVAVWPYWVTGCNLLFHRQTALDIGLFRADLGRRGRWMGDCEDLEFIDRARQAGHQTLIEPAGVVSHLVCRPETTLRYFVRQGAGHGVCVARMHLSVMVEPAPIQAGRKAVHAAVINLAAGWTFLQLLGVFSSRLALDLRVGLKVYRRRCDDLPHIAAGRTLRCSGEHAAFLRDRWAPTSRADRVRVSGLRRGRGGPAGIHLLGEAARLGAGGDPHAPGHP